MEKLYIIKIGGNVIDDDISFASFLRSFAAVSGKKLLIHGGGKIATEVGNRLGIESKYTEGRRITDTDTIDLVTMVYGGLINKKAVASLQSLGCNAIGITGADGGLIPATKRPVQQIDFGWVGDVKQEQVPVPLWMYLLAELVPVVAPLTHDGHGNMLNTNADTIAATLAKALSGLFEVSLIYCFEKAGVLSDPSEESAVLRELDRDNYRTLQRENKLFAGILPKLQNAFEAKEGGASDVRIGHAADLLSLVQKEAGTEILIKS